MGFVPYLNSRKTEGVKEEIGEMFGSRLMVADVYGSKKMVDEVYGSKKMVDEVYGSKHKIAEVYGSKPLIAEVYGSKSRVCDLYGSKGKLFVRRDIVRSSSGGYVGDGGGRNGGSFSVEDRPKSAMGEEKLECLRPFL